MLHKEIHKVEVEIEGSGDVLLLCREKDQERRDVREQDLEQKKKLDTAPLLLLLLNRPQSSEIRCI